MDARTATKAVAIVAIWAAKFKKACTFIKPSYHATAESAFTLEYPRDLMDYGTRMKSLALLFCLLPGSTYAAVITTVTCPSPLQYIEFTQEFQSYLDSSRSWIPPPTPNAISDMLGVILTKHSCNVDHSPGYFITDQADFDGIMFVEIQNKFYSGWMKADDYKKMYLGGSPQ